MNRSALTLALVSAAFAGNAAASAGRIDFSIGGVVATRPDGQQRPLAKGAELEDGDTIHTNNGRAQIRFPDGAYVSLQPNTVFGVKEYNYDGKPDGSERGFFSLLKGAMRAVTGLIGRVHRNAFAITTPTATVGIRGTGGLIVVLPDGSTLIRGSSGIWTLSNASGSIDVPAGTSGLAPADPSEPPQETGETPTVPPAPPVAGFVSGDERTSSGDPIIPIVPLRSGSGYAAVLAYSWSVSPFLEQSDSVNAIFNGANQLTSVNGPGLAGGVTVDFTLVNGSVIESGNDGVIAWGRWIGDASIPCDGPCSETYDLNSSLHYVIGMPTPALPTSGTASYTLLGATSPTYSDGHTAAGQFSGSMNVTFGAVASLGVSYTVAMPDGTYTMSTGRLPLTTIKGTSFFLGNPSVTSVGSVCASGCSSSVSGFFAGTNAERIGVGYQINDNLSGASVLGAAAFTK